MPTDLAFFVPYHTAYAHIEFVLSFASFADVHLFIYKWNPAQHLVKDYFASHKHVYIHEFSLENILSELIEQHGQQRRVVILLTASVNYPFGQSQLLYFHTIQKYTKCIVDVYSTGHCMYGCQSCAHALSYRLPITFTNYIRTNNSSSIETNKNNDILICPSFSSKDAPNSLLSNRDIVQQIIDFSFPHMIKLHPATYQLDNSKNPLFSFSELEQESTKRLLSSKNLIPVTFTNVLKLIEHAKVIICDSDSSIPFETLYFTDQKHILVYDTASKRENHDDRRIYFHVFHSAEQLTELLNLYFTGELTCKTKASHEFFLEKYDEPDGKEIERLAKVRSWMSNNYNFDQKIDIEKIKQEIKGKIESTSIQTTLYAFGEHTTSEIEELNNVDMDQTFGSLLQNIANL